MFVESTVASNHVEDSPLAPFVIEFEVVVVKPVDDILVVRHYGYKLNQYGCVRCRAT